MRPVLEILSRLAGDCEGGDCVRRLPVQEPLQGSRRAIDGGVAVLPPKVAAAVLVILQQRDRTARCYFRFAFPPSGFTWFATPSKQALLVPPPVQTVTFSARAFLSRER